MTIFQAGQDVIDLVLAGQKAQATADIDAGHPSLTLDVIGAVAERASLATESTSDSSVTVETGNKTLKLSENRGYKAGLPLLIRSAADPSGTWMAGKLTSDQDSEGNVTVDVTAFNGTGSAASWLVSVVLTFAVVASPPVAVADGGTGANTETGARASLEVALMKRIRAAQTAPPPVPGTGDAYLVLPNPTGDWSANVNDFAVWNGSTWDFESSAPGDFAFEIAGNGQVWYKNGAGIWAKVGEKGLGLLAVETVFGDTTLAQSSTDPKWRFIVLEDDLADYVVTLPSGVGQGTVFVIKNRSNFEVTVNVSGGANIDDAASVVLTTQNEVLRVVSVGSQWMTW